MAKRILLVCLISLVSAAAHAALYKWVDDNGQVHYGDKLPADAEKQEITGDISSYESVEVSSDNSGLGGLEENSGAVKKKRVQMYSAVWCV